MGGYHDTATHALWPDSDIGTVVELPHQTTFRTAELPFCRQVQATLYRLPIQHGVIFAAHDKRKVCQVGDDGPCSILPIQPHHSADRRKMVGLKTSP